MSGLELNKYMTNPKMYGIELSEDEVQMAIDMGIEDFIEDNG